MMSSSESLVMLRSRLNERKHQVRTTENGRDVNLERACDDE